MKPKDNFEPIVKKKVPKLKKEKAYSDKKLNKPKRKDKWEY